MIKSHGKGFFRQINGSKLSRLGKDKQKVVQKKNIIKNIPYFCLFFTKEKKILSPKRLLLPVPLCFLVSFVLKKYFTYSNTSCTFVFLCGLRVKKSFYLLKT